MFLIPKRKGALFSWPCPIFVGKNSVHQDLRKMRRKRERRQKKCGVARKKGNERRKETRKQQYGQIWRKK